VEFHFYSYRENNLRECVEKLLYQVRNLYPVYMMVIKYIVERIYNYRMK